MDIPVRKLSLSGTKLWSLPDRERYVFALAGHIFNELMFLQKMMLASVPSGDAHAFTKDASVGSAMFTLRIVISKVHEAMTELGRAATREIFLASILSRKEGLIEKWNSAIQHYESLPWLPAIRNQGGFHYMSFGQWAPHITEETCQEGYVIVGKTHGTSYFHWNEIAASLPIMKKIDAEQPLVGLGVAIDELGNLLGEIGECLALGLQAYLREVITDADPLGEEEVLTAHAVNEVQLNHFFSS